MQTRVVILSGRSLLAEGIASRLRQHPDRVALEFVDTREPNALALVASAKPSAVLLDAADQGATVLELVTRLQLEIPQLKIVWVDSEQDSVQMMSSQQLPATRVHDLLELIERK